MSCSGLVIGCTNYSVDVLKDTLNTISNLKYWQITDEEMYAKNSLKDIKLCDFLQDMDLDEEKIQMDEGNLDSKINKNGTRVFKVLGLSSLGGVGGGALVAFAVGSVLSGGILPAVTGIFSGAVLGLKTLEISTKNKYSTGEIYELRAIRLNEKAKKISQEILKNTKDTELKCDQLKTVRKDFVKLVRSYVDKLDAGYSYISKVEGGENRSGYEWVHVFNFHTNRYEYQYQYVIKEPTPLHVTHSKAKYDRPEELKEENLEK